MPIERVCTLLIVILSLLILFFLADKSIISAFNNCWKK
jgi:hypothetical protein